MKLTLRSLLLCLTAFAFSWATPAVADDHHHHSYNHGHDYYHGHDHAYYYGGHSHVYYSHDHGYYHGYPHYYYSRPVVVYGSPYYYDDYYYGRPYYRPSVSVAVGGYHRPFFGIFGH